MPTVALLEAYALEPHGWVEDTEPFVLDDDNRVVAYSWHDETLRLYKNVTVPEFVLLRAKVLCRNEAGEHVFRKLLWKEFTEPNTYYPNGVWELGFSPKVIRGEQTDVALMLPHEAMIVADFIPAVEPRGKHKNPRKPKVQYV